MLCGSQKVTKVAFTWKERINVAYDISCGQEVPRVPLLSSSFADASKRMTTGFSALKALTRKLPPGSTSRPTSTSHQSPRVLIGPI